MISGMRIENTENVKAFTIFDAPALDSVTVVLQDFGCGRGRLIVEYWGNAWSAYWGAMGDMALAEFIIGCHPQYIATKLEPTTHRQTKATRDLLITIAEVVQSAIPIFMQINGR